jgi:hypothetical protein
MLMVLLKGSWSSVSATAGVRKSDFRWLPQNVIIPALLSVAGTIKACTYGVKDRSQNQRAGCKKEEENAL